MYLIGQRKSPSLITKGVSPKNEVTLYCSVCEEKFKTEYDSKILPSGRLQNDWQVQDRSCRILKEKKYPLVKFSYYATEEL